MTDFHGMKRKKKRKEKKIQNGRRKKTEFFKIANSRYFFVKISLIGPWISRIENEKGIDVAQLIWP